MTRSVPRWRLYGTALLFVLVSASCGAIEVQWGVCDEIAVPAVVAPGETVTVSGTGFERGACATGPQGCTSRMAPVPDKDIDITFHQGERSWVLATVDADGELQIKAEVIVPAEADPGPALIRARTAEAEVTVESTSP